MEHRRGVGEAARKRGKGGPRRRGQKSENPPYVSISSTLLLGSHLPARSNAHRNDSRLGKIGTHLSSTQWTGTSRTAMPAEQTARSSSVSKNQPPCRVVGRISSVTRRDTALKPHCASLQPSHPRHALVTASFVRRMRSKWTQERGQGNCQQVARHAHARTRIRAYTRYALLRMSESPDASSREEHPQKKRISVRGERA